jgi:D-alanyl-D-alanine carboxypeptidase (penicillin-binding protein 5/6)
MELVAVVMGCETSAQRFDACRKMLDHGFASYALAQPELPEKMEVIVKLGAQESVQAVPARQQAILLQKAQKGSLSTQVELEEEVTAPVSKGQRLGTLTVTAGGQTLAQIPLVAEEAVPRLTFGQIFLKILRRVTMAAES